MNHNVRKEQRQEQKENRRLRARRQQQRDNQQRLLTLRNKMQMRSIQQPAQPKQKRNRAPNTEPRRHHRRKESVKSIFGFSLRGHSDIGF